MISTSVLKNIMEMLYKLINFIIFTRLVATKIIENILLSLP